MNEPVVRDGVPLINIDGTPALCKEEGCCLEEGGTEDCPVCSSLVPRFLRFELNSTWEDGNYVKGPFDPECVNCTGCSALTGLDFVVPYIPDTSTIRCRWYGVYDLGNLASCMYYQATVFVHLERLGAVGTTVTLEVHATLQTLIQQPIGCNFANIVTVAEKVNVADITNWDCGEMSATILTPARLHDNSPTCAVTGGSITIGTA